jgi:hypothetical protein
MFVLFASIYSKIYSLKFTRKYKDKLNNQFINLPFSTNPFILVNKRRRGK